MLTQLRASSEGSSAHANTRTEAREGIENQHGIAALAPVSSVSLRPSSRCSGWRSSTSRKRMNEGPWQATTRPCSFTRRRSVTEVGSSGIAATVAMPESVLELARAPTAGGHHGVTNDS